MNDDIRYLIEEKPLKTYYTCERCEREITIEEVMVDEFEVICSRCHEWQMRY